VTRKKFAADRIEEVKVHCRRKPEEFSRRKYEAYNEAEAAASTTLPIW
jgi:hypothetical protein